MKRISNKRFAGLVVLAALLLGSPLLSAGKKNEDKDEDKDYKKCEKYENCAKVPDSRGGLLLALAGGALGAAVLVQRRRKITS
jgi:hypothetical protein